MTETRWYRQDEMLGLRASLALDIEAFVPYATIHARAYEALIQRLHNAS